MYLRRNQTIFLVVGITDMRKQINGLAAIVQEHLPDGPCSGNYFVFLGKTRRVMKILYWDRTGFCLWTKRLEADTFPWTRKKSGLMELDRDRFRLLMKGIDIFREHKTRSYTTVA